LGSSIAGYLSGSVYEQISDKISLIYKDALTQNIILPKLSDTFTKTDLINEYLNKTGFTVSQMTKHLWNIYEPYKIMYIYASIGVFTALGLFVYDKIVRK
jgi:hypothetical protein